jgi:hypothetical protein
MNESNFSKSIPVMLIAIIAVVLLTSSLVEAQDSNISMKVSFDTSSIEAIVSDPANILKTEDEFWATDSAYRLSVAWHDGAGVPRTEELMEDWRGELRTLAKMPLSERQNLPYYRLALDVNSKQEMFSEKAVPHLLSFLPNLHIIKIDTTVFLTAFTHAYAFSTNGQMVINQSSSFWGNDLNKVLNLLTHELFHVGHGNSLGYAKEDPLEDSLKNEFLMTLHGEGIATYVGYTIQEVFPSVIQDHVMMVDPNTVREKIAQVNAIFEKADTTQAGELRKLSWDVGVGERAYYVVGGHMARTIDQNLGRATLVSTIEYGPLSFIDTYNELVPKEEQILRFPGPNKNSSILRLKEAALSGDDSAIDEIKLDLATKNAGKEKQLATSLNSLGYKIYYAFENPEAAIKVLTIGTELDPDAAYILDSIGEIYLLEKDYVSSEKFCRKALELDPHLGSSINMLKKIAEMRKEIKGSKQSVRVDK